MLLAWAACVVVTLVAVAFMALVVVRHVLSKRPSGAPPGPPLPWPWVRSRLTLPWYGNLVSLGHPNGPHEALYAVAQQYGDIASLKLGGVFTVVLSSADAVHEAMVQHATAFAGRVMLPTTRILSHNGQDLVFSDYNASWKLQRKLAHAALFNTRKLNSNAAAMQREMASLVHMLQSHGQQGSTPVAVRPWLQLTSMNIISRIVLSQSFRRTDDEFQRLTQAMANIFKCLGAANTADYLDGYPSFINSSQAAQRPLCEMAEAQGVVLNMVSRHLEEHKASFDADAPPRDFLDTLLAARQVEAQKKGVAPSKVFSDTKIALVVMDLFLAGTDTSSTTVEWFIGLLANHPHVQAELQAEVDGVVPASRDPTPDDIASLPLLMSAIKETLRLKTVVPITRRTTTRDVTLRNFHIPKGTLVLSNVWAVHHDPKTHVKPFNFDPRRFLDMDRGREGKVFIPFGVGTRQCTGMNLGLQEVAMATIYLLRSFSFAPPPDVAKLDLHPVYGQTMHPKAFSVLCKPRASSSNISAAADNRQVL